MTRFSFFIFKIPATILLGNFFLKDDTEGQLKRWQVCYIIIQVWRIRELLTLNFYKKFITNKSFVSLLQETDKDYVIQHWNIEREKKEKLTDSTIRDSPCRIRRKCARSPRQSRRCRRRRRGAARSTWMGGLFWLGGPALAARPALVAVMRRTE